MHHWAVWSRKPTAAPIAGPSARLVLQSLLVQSFELSRGRAQQQLLNYRRKLSSRRVIFSAKTRQRLVGLGCFEVLTFGNRLATDPILRVSSTQFSPMVPHT